MTYMFQWELLNCFWYWRYVPLTLLFIELIICLEALKIEQDIYLFDIYKQIDLKRDQQAEP